jgi:hypothetical protein
MENTDKKLSFPQRNWFLLCVLVAILSPLVVHWLQTGAHKESYQQSIDIKSKDSSYKIANPPGTDSAPHGGKTATDSASH